jgi:hypothetical protein
VRHNVLIEAFAHRILTILHNIASRQLEGAYLDQGISCAIATKVQSELAAIWTKARPTREAEGFKGLIRVMTNITWADVGAQVPVFYEKME